MDEETEVFLGLLQEKFAVTIGSLENFLGMQMKCQSDGSIFVSQKAYTNKILKKFKMTEAKVRRQLQKGVSTTASPEETDNNKNVSGKVLQSVSRLVDITAGGDFLELCDQKRSYKHLSDFGRL